MCGGICLCQDLYTRLSLHLTCVHVGGDERAVGFEPAGLCMTSQGANHSAMDHFAAQPDLRTWAVAFARGTAAAELHRRGVLWTGERGLHSQGAAAVGALSVQGWLPSGR